MLVTTLGLVFLYRRDWTKYYALFVIAMFNWETTCFLTIVFRVTSLGKVQRRELVLHLGAQLAIWLAVKLLLYGLFSGNPSGSAAVAGVFDANFRQHPQRLSSPSAFLSLLVCAPFFAGMLLVGNIIETRIFGELIPVVLCGFLLAVRELVGRSTR